MSSIERPNRVTLRGNPVTLVGPELEVGQPAPDFRAIDTGLQARSLADYAGHVLLIASILSVDTGVCDPELRRFNQEAASVNPDVRVLAFSMDLPFTQKRWCGAAGIDRLITLSDHRDASFGTAYGTLIKDLRYLARAVFVVGRDGLLRYVEYVPEVATHPNYEAALAALRQAART